MKSNQKLIKRNSLEDGDSLPKGALEIPSEGEGYDSNYEIYTSQENKHNIRQKSNPSTGKSSGRVMSEDKLRQKITEQATRLTNLESYKAVCEQRIRQLIPSHNIPVKESDLKTIPTDPKGKNLVQYYNSIIEAKEKEIEVLKKRVESAPANTNTNTISTVNKNILAQNIDKLPVDKVKEAYYKLLNFTNELSSEKELILESLREETVTNESQRNYIEMLRQTIESSIVKHGMTSLLQSINSNSNSNKSSNNNVDLVIDIARIKSDADKHRKELVMAQVLISELKQEIDVLKKTNEDMNIKKEKIKESLENGIEELEQAKSQVKILEIEKNDVVRDYDECKRDNKKLLEELDEAILVKSKCEKDIQDYNRRISELQSQLENHFALQNKFNEYKRSFEKLYEDFEKLLKEKSNFEIENEHYKEEINMRNEEVNRLKSILEETEEKYENDKLNWVSENEEFNRNNKKLERLYSDINISYKDKEKELAKLQEKHQITERNFIITKAKLEEVSEEADVYKKSSERKSDNDEKNIRELNGLVKDMKKSIENLSCDKENIFTDYVSVKNECDKLDLELRKLITENNNKERSLSKLNDQYESLCKDFNKLEEAEHFLREDKDNLTQDLKFWKEKYDKDTVAKSGEINSLNKELSIKMRDIDELTHNKEYLETQIDKLEDQIRFSNSDIKTLQSHKEDLNKKIEKLNSDLMKQTQINKEINNDNHQLSLKTDDFLNQINTLAEDKEKSEKSKQRLLDELDSMRKSDKESQMKIHNLNANLQEVKNLIFAVQSIIRNYNNKFTIVIDKFAREDSSEVLLSSNFVEFVKRINRDNAVVNPNLNTKEVIRQIEDSIRTVFSEVELLHDQAFNNNIKLQSTFERTKTLEQKLRTNELCEEEKSSNERKLRISLQEVNEDRTNIKLENENLEKQLDKAVKEIKLLRSEVNRLSEENNLNEDSLSKQNTLNETLIKEMRDKEHLLNNASFQVDALEERIVILVKEKKYLESLLNRLSKSHPDREVNRIVNEIMNINDSLALLERDRVRLEDNLIQLEEGRTGVKAPNKDKLKSLTYEYDCNIEDLKQQIKKLEADLKTIEISEKNASNLLYEYEYKIKQLQKELGDVKDELRRYKTMTINTAFKSERDRNRDRESFNPIGEDDFAYLELDRAENLVGKRMDTAQTNSQDFGFSTYERRDMPRVNNSTESNERYQNQNKLNKRNTDRSYNVRETLNNSENY